MSPSSTPRTIVFVHGAWADGSCWSNIILPLERKGMQVISASIPMTSLSDDTAALRRAIARTNGPLTLVAHAYGGAVTAAVDDQRVRSLVYVAALAPDENETVADVFYRATPHPEAPRLAPDEYGFIWMPEDGFRRAVAHKASSEQLAILAAVQRPIAVKCIQEKSPRPAWKTKPSWYLLAEDDRMIPAETQRFMAERMGAKIQSHPVDHSPMQTHPELVTKIIVDASRETTSN